MTKILKVMSIGNEKVGKSCIIRRYCGHRFSCRYTATIGLDYGIVKTNVNGRNIRVNVFDTSGNSVFSEIRKEFYVDINGIILVYDISNRSSYTALTKWLTEIMENLANETVKNKVVCILCGNKRDNKREVNENEAKLWANMHGFLFCETSALTGEGVQNMFEQLVECILKTFEEDKQPLKLNHIYFNSDQLRAINHLQWAKNDYDKLGLYPGASREEINKAYRKLAILLHPDKSNIPGSENAFKMLVAARRSLLKRLSL